MAFAPSGNSDHSIVVSVSIHFPSNSKQDALFHCIAYDYYCAEWDSLCDDLRDVPWEDKLGTSAAASEFFEWFKLELMHISLIISIRSSLTHLHGFQLLVLLPLFKEITFFVFTNRLNLLKLKESSARLAVVAKGFLKLLNLHMLIKQNSLSFRRNLALGSFGKLLIVFSTKVNLLYLLYSMARRHCLLHGIKQNCSLKFFQKTLNLMTRVSLCPFFLLELI